MWCRYGVRRKLNWACFTVTCSARPPPFFFKRNCSFYCKSGLLCMLCVPPASNMERHFAHGVSRDSAVSIATRYWLDGPVIESRWGARFSAPVQTGPGTHPAPYTMGTGSFPGVKRPGRGVDHQPPSSAKVKEKVELCLYSFSGPSWPVLG